MAYPDTMGLYAPGISIPGIAGMLDLNIPRSGLRQIEKYNVLGFDKWDFFGIGIWRYLNIE